jgi:microcystin-dependent protein
MFAGNFAPSGYQLCNGQLLSISQNTALFAIIGTYYGGDGVTTFALPNMQGRVPIHQGNGVGLSPYIIGQQGGNENITLTSGQMPQHNHLVNASAAGASQDTPTNNLLAKAQTYTNSAANTTMLSTMIGFSGSSQPHANIQPYLCVSFIIAIRGLFPPRN